MGNICSCTSEKAKTKKNADKAGHGSGKMDQEDSLLSNRKGTKKALLIGMNYIGQEGELGGCINDVNNMKSLIRSQGITEDQDHMLILTDDQEDSRYQPTQNNISEGMNWLVRGAQRNDSLFLFFHYAGHGSQITDQEGDSATVIPVLVAAAFNNCATKNPLKFDTYVALKIQCQ